MSENQTTRRYSPLARWGSQSDRRMRIALTGLFTGAAAFIAGEVGFFLWLVRTLS